jgi:hypothetical protein
MLRSVSRLGLMGAMAPLTVFSLSEFDAKVV